MATIYFDMDGTIADFYAVPEWLTFLRAENPTPYRIARPLVNMSRLARLIHKMQRNGYKVGIISWGSKNATSEYNEAVAQAKKWWLAKHLPSVLWDEIKIAPYGTPKSTLADDEERYLFDDELPNLKEWGEGAFPADEIFEVLTSL